MMNAEHLTSPLLRSAAFRHAFFTRRGGASEGPFATLNFSASLGDTRERVAENHRRAAVVLEVNAAQIYCASQVHGSEARLVQPDEDPEVFQNCEADAVVSITSGIACAVRSADCVPILIGDRASGAVTAIHAGWRGVVRRVVDSGVARLRQAIGGDGDLVAAIGPHLSVEHFAVSPDIAEQLRAASPDADVIERGRPKPHVNLRRIVRAQLRAIGLAETAIDDVFGCTYADSARFFSFRRDGKISGRHLSAIVAR